MNNTQIVFLIFLNQMFAACVNELSQDENLIKNSQEQAGLSSLQGRSSSSKTMSSGIAVSSTSKIGQVTNSSFGQGCSWSIATCNGISSYSVESCSGMAINATMNPTGTCISYAGNSYAAEVSIAKNLTITSAASVIRLTGDWSATSGLFVQLNDGKQTGGCSYTLSSEDYTQSTLSIPLSAFSYCWGTWSALQVDAVQGFVFGTTKPGVSLMIQSLTVQ